MRRTRTPHLTACLAVVAVMAATCAGVVSAPQADAASGRWIAYQGKSINLASLPATTVTLTAYSPTPSRRVEFVLDGRVVGRDDRVEQVGTRWVAEATADLTGAVGKTRLRTRYVTSTSGTHSVDHSIRAIAPAPRGWAPRPQGGGVPGAGGTTTGSGTPLSPESRPGPRSTGVTQRTPLVPSGPLELYRSGEVVEGLDIDGCVSVYAPDVTIRNSRIRCRGVKYQPVVEVQEGASRLALEDVEIDGLGVSQVCVGWGRYTLRRANLHNCADGARLGSDVVIEDSWIHDMARVGTLHSDAVQTTSGTNVVIRRNTLDVNTYAKGRHGNAALMIGSELGTREVRDFLVENNYITGGGFSINVRGDINASNLVIKNNVFGTDALFGQAIAPPRISLGQGNVVEGSRAPIKVSAAR